MTYTRLFTHKPKVPVPMPDLADFMTTKEAAKLLGFNVKSVRDLVYKGKLKSSHFGRSLLIPRDSVKDYIKKTTGMSKNDPRRGK
jgi:excisionase family DNA binding protein